jgi:O-antigen ligase
MSADRHHRPRWVGLAFFGLTAALLALCLLIGGASRLNAVQLTLLELSSLPLLGWALWRVTREGLWPTLKAPAVILLGILAVAAIQLIPLPPGLWSSLPGHGEAAEALTLAGVEIGWRPLTLTPDLTVTHLLALLPAIALFLAAVLLRPSQQAWLLAVIVAFALISLALGAMQAIDGPDSNLYLYSFVNRDNAVGLFANRNHQASLMVAVLPLAAAAAAIARDRRLPPLPLWVALGVVFLAIIPFVVILKSRAGVLLLLPSLIASLAILWPPRGALPGFGRRGVLALAAVIIVGMVIGGAFALGPVLERFAENQEGRLLSGPIAARAAWDLMPFGGGLGSFRDIYAGVEPLDMIAVSYWQHAHNDYLQIWLEAGVPGLIVVLLFLAWWAWAGVGAWRAATDERTILARAGAVALGLMLIHSLVDYPLRTPAMMAVFAVACAVLATAGRRSRRGGS